ncbi:MAG: FAD-dependent oxidoreductase [Pseudomonadota bacterium]
MSKPFSFSRRRFLSYSAGAAAVSTLPSRPTFAETTTNRIDVAIVGGGIAGLYCAHRLASDTDAGVHVFEASDHMGGRVATTGYQGFEALAEDKSAMRLPASDRISIQLAKALLGPAALKRFHDPRPNCFLRGQKFDAFSGSESLPYDVKPAELELISNGKNLAVEVINALSKDPGVLKNRGFRDLMLRELSREGLNYLQDTLGSEVLLSNWNAPAAVEWFQTSYSPNGEFVSVVGGLERLPTALAASVQANGAVLSTGHSLTSLARDRAGKFHLGLSSANGEVKVRADRLILAIPPASIAQLDDKDGLLRGAQFQSALRSVLPQKAGTIYMSFDHAWWKKEGKSAEHHVTDLPVRRSHGVGADPESGRALLMASHHDGSTVDYWRSLGRGPVYSGRADPVDNSLVGRIGYNDTRASRLLTAEAIRQIQAVYGIKKPLPEPLAVTFQEWSVERTGAAWHQWAIGADPEAQMAYLRNPLAGMHICGEAWSHEQGWVAGALNSAEAMLNEQFALSSFV